MSLQYSNPLSYICEGCLSTDRRLSIIYDEEYKRMYLDFLDSMDNMNQQPLLCWECTAILRSVIRFKKQVRTAHDCLVRYMVCQTTHITPLSNLTKTINNTTIEYYQDVEDDKNVFLPNDNSLYNEITESNFVNPQIIKVASNYETEFPNVPDNEVIRESDNDNQPLFIKIEDSDFQFSESYYEDENSIEDKQIPDNAPVTEVPSSKKSKKKKKRKKDEFDASDDEPLKPKKQRKSVLKDEIEDKSAKKRRKKEKPAGVVSNPRVSRNLEKLNVKDGQVEMVVLSWEEVEAERQRARESVVFTRHEYRCDDCVIGFNHRFKLDNHMAKHAPSAGAAECPVCRVRCRDDHALVAHKRRHRVRWRCVACGELASRAAVAADHAARAHGAAPTHTCRRCGLTLTSLAKLRNHMKSHGERQKCELCGKTFRDRTSLRTHLFIHRGEKEYSCPHCEKRFLFKKAMEVHVVTHAAPAQLYCHECDMTFKNRMSFYQHKKYNLKHIDPAKLKYQCALCDKKFLKATRLEEHNFAVHLKVTPIRCPVPDCGFACSSRPVLRAHTRLVHRRVRAARNHVCDTCGKAYTTKKTLEGHMRSHTGERPFQCSLCPSTFCYEAALYNHNRLVHLKGEVRPRAYWCATRGSHRRASVPVLPLPVDVLLRGGAVQPQQAGAPEGRGAARPADANAV